MNSYSEMLYLRASKFYNQRNCFPVSHLATVIYSIYGITLTLLPQDIARLSCLARETIFVRDPDRSIERLLLEDLWRAKGDSGE